MKNEFTKGAAFVELLWFSAFYQLDANTDSAAEYTPLE